MPQRVAACDVNSGGILLSGMIYLSMWEDLSQLPCEANGGNCCRTAVRYHQTL